MDKVIQIPCPMIPYNSDRKRKKNVLLGVSKIISLECRHAVGLESNVLLGVSKIISLECRHAVQSVLEAE